VRLQDIKVGDKFRHRNGYETKVTTNDGGNHLPIYLDGHGWISFSSLLENYTRIDQPLSSRVAELEAELAALKAEKAKPAYDYMNPRKGDLFRDERDGGIVMAIIAIGVPLNVIVLSGSGAGYYQLYNNGFGASPQSFTFLGNINDNPKLLKESLP
jgi:hypothetical protein